MDKKGKLIVIEGLDGAGKSTQFELTYDRISNKCENVKKISFPDYNEKSSVLVKMYLDGEFSKNAADVNAYAASTFYAADRYASYMKRWRADYQNGSLILVARYTTSNCIYQMTKLEEKDWDFYLDWLFDYEYNKLELPEPDAVIFLDMPVEISQKLLTSRYNGDEAKKDVHEINVDFLHKCRRSALYAAEKYGWHILECSRNGKPKTIAEINDSLFQLIYRLL